MAALGNNGDDLGLLGEKRFKFWDKNDVRCGDGRFNDKNNR
jgi:hypothetical protein